MFYKKKYITQILYFENIAISYSIGFLINGIYYANQTAFLKEYKKITPGKALVVKIIDDIDRLEIKKIDLGCGEGHYKESITNNFNIVFTFIYSPNIFVQNYLRLAFTAKNWIYRLLSKNPKIYMVYKIVQAKILI